MEHSRYDKRGYPIVDVREGYGEWVRTYEQTVQDEMDLRLLERLETADWAGARRVLDLACGTGRIGAWLRGRCPGAVDGVDITPEMLEVASRKGVYRTLAVADVTSTGLPAGTYDLCIQSLADEHLPDLRPLYQEVARLAPPGGRFVIVGFHPQFLMAGVPTHYDRAPGEAVAIRSYVHLLSDHVKAARAVGWSLLEMDEVLVDETWLRKKPKWGGQGYLGLPISFAVVWRRTDPPRP
ncbi:MAG TPA: class I SAM-dependent methyltransferase [Methylomirabilota bacterium]|jgi:SAM-dependent methyltransferase